MNFRRIFEFTQFYLNNLNYNCIKHVFLIQRKGFFCNQQYFKNLWEIIYIVTFTKICHIVSFLILVILFFYIFYLLLLRKYKNSFIISKLECENIYPEIIWMVVIVIIIITSWNLHLLLISTLFICDYSRTMNKIRSSFFEDFYINPIGFIFLVFYIDKRNLTNVIHINFVALVQVLYFISFYSFKVFFTELYGELTNIIDFKKQKNIIKQANFISIFFIIEAAILFIYNYILIQEMNSFHKFIFLSKGIYLFYKIFEVWKIYFDQYKFSESNVEIKEKIFFKNLYTKSFLELGDMIYIFIQISSCLIFWDSAHTFFNALICGFIFILGFQILTYFKKYKEITGYLLGLDSCLEIAEIKENKECVICTEKMTNCRKLSCNHQFHLICLSKWFENGHNFCPICRTEVKFSEKMKKIINNRINIYNINAHNNEQNINNIFSFNSNNNFF